MIMANVSKILKISSAGIDTGTFDVVTNEGITLLTGVTRAQLLAGVLITYNDATTNLITVTDTGDCGGTVSIEVVIPVTYYSIGTGDRINGNVDCNIIGETIEMYLNQADYDIFTANGGCLSDGSGNIVASVRKQNGQLINQTYYFIYNGLQNCQINTFKCTNGTIMENSIQC